jgi:hypothetical protein
VIWWTVSLIPYTIPSNSFKNTINMVQYQILDIWENREMSEESRNEWGIEKWVRNQEMSEESRNESNEKSVSICSLNMNWKAYLKIGGEQVVET